VVLGKCAGKYIVFMFRTFNWVLIFQRASKFGTIVLCNEYLVSYLLQSVLNLDLVCCRSKCLKKL
jgi:hypothetical protein